ncbi:MAG: hypothetical protein GX821_03480 [Clostridiaceae bacterium]|jgi:hypothetical protein|nr:hypothetical protein [Eubacteriales bacterium]MDD4140425.1 hypothetical protein [Eubacteriales bacterium]MDD4744334.1 hypothetical protein [Eubacteriales bacterium]NLB44209.1 hypothetical protein [Clostridiaceae bacterium]
MNLESAREEGNYRRLLEHARTLLPAGTDEQTVRQVAWLYIQYGCNNYTDGPGYPFRPEDVQDAVRLSRQEGIELAARLVRLGVLALNQDGRCVFTSRWR